MKRMNENDNLTPEQSALAKDVMNELKPSSSQYWKNPKSPANSVKVNGIEYKAVTWAEQALGTAEGYIAHVIRTGSLPNDNAYGIQTIEFKGTTIHAHENLVPQGSPCTVNGTDYISMTAAGQAYGMDTRDGIANIIAQGYFLVPNEYGIHSITIDGKEIPSRERQKPLPLKGPVKITINDTTTEYPSPGEADRGVGIRRLGTISEFITGKRPFVIDNKYGISRIEFNGKVIEPTRYQNHLRGASYSITINGIDYESIRSACSKLGISRSWLRGILQGTRRFIATNKYGVKSIIYNDLTFSTLDHTKPIKINGVEYPSATDAELALGLDPGYLTGMLSDQSKFTDEAIKDNEHGIESIEVETDAGETKSISASPTLGELNSSAIEDLDQSSEQDESSEESDKYLTQDEVKDLFPGTQPEPTYTAEELTDSITEFANQDKTDHYAGDYAVRDEADLLSIPLDELIDLVKEHEDRARLILLRRLERADKIIREGQPDLTQ